MKKRLFLLASFVLVAVTVIKAIRTINSPTTGSPTLDMDLQKKQTQEVSGEKRKEELAPLVEEAKKFLLPVSKIQNGSEIPGLLNNRPGLYAVLQERQASQKFFKGRTVDITYKKDPPGFFEKLTSFADDLEERQEQGVHKAGEFFYGTGLILFGAEVYFYLTPDNGIRISVEKYSGYFSIWTWPN